MYDFCPGTLAFSSFLGHFESGHLENHRRAVPPLGRVNFPPSLPGLVSLVHLWKGLGNILPSLTHATNPSFTNGFQ